MRNTPLGGRGGERKKPKKPKPEKAWIPAFSQLFCIYRQVYAECVYTKHVSTEN